jgi:hypothetical protein
MYTRKRKKRKTKRGGLGPEVYMMTGMLAVLNGLMMTFPSFESYNPCDKPVATIVDATIVDSAVNAENQEKFPIKNEYKSLQALGANDPRTSPT